MDYVRNCWYVAGWSNEFDEALEKQTILEENIVLYRTSEGEVAALEDRCPHKFLPLSMGKRIGDDIQCGYHGMTFGPHGRCVRIPGQDNLPNTAYVHRYPTHEKHGIVWIWMGEPERADPADIFDIPQFTDPAWSPHFGEALHLDSNYLNVADNLCDPAHVSFVHPTTLGNSAGEDVPVKTERDGSVVVTSRWIRNAPPIGFFQKFGGFTENVDRWHYYYLYVPNIAVIDFGSSDAKAELPEERRSEGVQVFALHFLTPTDATHTVDRWMHIRNTALDDDTAGDTMNDLFKVAFDEDKAILKAVQEEESRIPGRRPVRLAIDVGSNLYRKMVDELVAGERQAAE